MARSLSRGACSIQPFSAYGRGQRSLFSRQQTAGKEPLLAGNWHLSGNNVSAVGIWAWSLGYTITTTTTQQKYPLYVKYILSGVAKVYFLNILNALFLLLNGVGIWSLYGTILSEVASRTKRIEVCTGDRDNIQLLVFSVTSFKIDRNKDHNRSVD